MTKRQDNINPVHVQFLPIIVHNVYPTMYSHGQELFYKFVSKMTKIDFTQNLSGRKILQFSHCVFRIKLPRSVANLELQKIYVFQSFESLSLRK